MMLVAGRLRLTVVKLASVDLMVPVILLVREPSGAGGIFILRSYLSAMHRPMRSPDMSSPWMIVDDHQALRFEWLEHACSLW